VLGGPLGIGGTGGILGNGVGIAGTCDNRPYAAAN